MGIQRYISGNYIMGNRNPHKQYLWDLGILPTPINKY